MLAASLARADNPPAPPLEDKKLEADITTAVQRGVDYLKRMQADDGPWRRLWHAGSMERWNTTVMVVHAMTMSRAGPRDTTVQKALRWINRQRKPYGAKAGWPTNISSHLILALSRIDAHKYKSVIHKHASLLLGGQYETGSWGGRHDRAHAVSGQSSSTRLAIDALWAANKYTGFAVPRQTWVRAWDACKQAQFPQGFWVFAIPPNPQGRGDRFHSTAAVLTSYLQASAALGSLQAARESKTAQVAWAWLLANKPRRKSRYGSALVKLAATLMAVPLADWYLPHARELVHAQKKDGSWDPVRPRGRGAPKDNIRPTVNVLLFLARSHPPETAAERFPDVGKPRGLRRAFDIYREYDAKKRAQVILRFAAAGPAAIGHFVERLQDKEVDVRTTAHELLTKLLRRRFVFDPKAAVEERAKMLKPIEAFWTNLGYTLVWDEQEKRFVSP